VSALSNFVEFAKVIASAVTGPNSAVTFNLTGIGDFLEDAAGNVIADDDSDEKGEQSPEQPAFQALGIVGRPLPPTAAGHLEAMAVRTSDGLEPFAYRDLRINRALNPGGGNTAPTAGQAILASYGGGFASVKHNATSGLDNVTLYVPYDFDGDGVPQKAHAIIIDPSGDSTISLVHGDGVFVSLTGDTGTGPGLVAAVDGGTFFRMSAGELVLQAAKIMLKGNVYLGAQAETGVPALLTTGFPAPVPPQPSPSVFLSLV